MPFFSLQCVRLMDVPVFFRRICCYRVRSTWKSQKDALGIKQVLFSDDDRVGCPSLSPKHIVFRFHETILSFGEPGSLPYKWTKKKQYFFHWFPTFTSRRGSGTGRAPHWSWLVPSTVEGRWLHGSGRSGLGQQFWLKSSGPPIPTMTSGKIHHEWRCRFSYWNWRFSPMSC